MKDETFETIENSLRNLKRIGPSMPYRDGLKLRLIEELVGRRVLPRQNYFGWRFALLASLVVVFLAGGSVVLAQNSLPGQPLYPVKRGVENVKMVFVMRDERPKVEKKLAETRIDELKEAAKAENKQAATSAVREVEESLNKISLQVISARNKYRSLTDQNSDSQTAKKILEDLLQILVDKQAILAEIENSLPEPERSQIQIVRENLKTLQLDIEKDLNMLEDGSTEESVKGTQTQEDTQQLLQPSLR